MNSHDVVYPTPGSVDRLPPVSNPPGWEVLPVPEGNPPGARGEGTLPPGNNTEGVQSSSIPDEQPRPGEGGPGPPPETEGETPLEEESPSLEPPISSESRFQPETFSQDFVSLHGKKDIQYTWFPEEAPPSGEDGVEPPPETSGNAAPQGKRQPSASPIPVSLNAPMETSVPQFGPPPAQETATPRRQARVFPGNSNDRYQPTRRAPAFLSRAR